MLFWGDPDWRSRCWLSERLLPLGIMGLSLKHSVPQCRDMLLAIYIISSRATQEVAAYLVVVSGRGKNTRRG